MPSIRGMTQIFGDSVPGTTVRVRGLLSLGSAGRLRSFLSCCFRFAREFCCPEPEMKAIFLRLPGFWALLSTRKYTNTFLDYALQMNFKNLCWCHHVKICKYTSIQFIFIQSACYAKSHLLVES